MNKEIHILRLYFKNQFHDHFVENITIENLRVRGEKNHGIIRSQNSSGVFKKHPLQFKWLVYPENEKYSEQLNLATESATTSFVFPELKNKESIPILLNVIDNGSPWMVSYKRVILNPE